jgi:hypothetical protein
MRTALLISLIVLGAAGAAQAQSTFRPYNAVKPQSADRDPYDLPKAYQTNPYDRDYSKNRDDTAAYKNTYKNQRDDGYSNGYGANRNSSSSSSYGSGSGSSTWRPAGSQSNNRCKPGLVC